MKRKRVSKQDAPLSWLPFDSRLIPSLFSFGTVRGVAKIFLGVEMILAAGVVIGTMLILVFQLYSLQ